MGGTQDVTQPQWPILPRLSERLHLGEIHFIHYKTLKFIYNLTSKATLTYDFRIYIWGGLRLNLTLYVKRIIVQKYPSTWVIKLILLSKSYYKGFSYYFTNKVMNPEHQRFLLNPVKLIVIQVQVTNYFMWW